MTTPYDAALRLGRREMDDMRVSISTQTERLAALQSHRDAVDRAVHEERRATDMPHGFSSDAYMARMRAQREALKRDHMIVDAQLNGLRLQAAEAFGALTAIEGAAGRHVAEAARRAASAEQAQIDDFSAARFTRAQRDARSARIDADRTVP